MKTKELIKIIVPILLAIVLSIISYQYLVAYFGELFEISFQMKNEFLSIFHYGLYSQCLMLFFALISLPFIFSVFTDKLNVNRNNLSKIIIVLEVAGFLLAYLTTPPDFASTIMIFMVWQFPVAVNLITLFKITKRREENISNNS